jgi:hypothetical protein
VEGRGGKGGRERGRRRWMTSMYCS